MVKTSLFSIVLSNGSKVTLLWLVRKALPLIMVGGIILFEDLLLTRLSFGNKRFFTRRSVKRKIEFVKQAHKLFSVAKLVLCHFGCLGGLSSCPNQSYLFGFQWTLVNIKATQTPQPITNFCSPTDGTARIFLPSGNCCN